MCVHHFCNSCKNQDVAFILQVKGNDSGAIPKYKSHKKFFKMIWGKKCLIVYFLLMHLILYLTAKNKQQQQKNLASKLGSCMFIFEKWSIV